MKYQLFTGATLSLLMFGTAGLPVKAEPKDPVADFVNESVAPIGGFGAAVGGNPGKVLGAGAAGAKFGVFLEEKTGAGSKAGDWLYNNSNRKTAGEAVDNFDEASSDWKKGNYGDAVVDSAEGAGNMLKGYVNW
jgi:hypothetical protein